jgi:MarR family transcriptional regulator, organic hydroperoxide resistance regulator
LRGWASLEKTSAINNKKVAEIEKSLRMISGIIKQKGREILANFEITPPQFVALQWLLDYGDLTIGDLSNKMYLACSTTTDLVDRMEKNELVTRKRSEKDRRVVQIHLLPKGKEIIGEVINNRQQYLSEMLNDFSNNEIEDLDKLMQKLYEQMKEE